ncbi:peptidylprolyl isomerase [Gracilimonas sediminicola]|uniref:Peptidylprolyl isomerase n=1 Tax=Gracilimonas sediminicola TaxID=2952158 RepID=A0A9X2L725_9BACT|nr:peptidylprolyl isomerase [Gracilimonas sediminicola]MCP9292758.1 peptidylprolyl isomerase [Gracilimonas sediminicola]
MANQTYRLFLSLFLLCVVPSLIYGQSKNDKTVVGKVGNQEVTYAELKKNYSSGSSEEPTLDDLESFLPIYLDYKAKLLAAKDQGYFEDSALVAEHESYVKQAAYAFWLENEIKPAAFDEFKKRAEMELKTYHILVAVGPDAPQQQVDEALSKLKQARQEITDGVPLDEVNGKYSTVRGGRSMGGDIPWISVGRTVQEFEDVVYGLEVGEISEPFKTQFGYHIVLLQDKRERTPARLVNHIFVRGTGDSTAYDKIHNAYNALEDGQPWNLVLNQFTEDGASKRSNGRIGWVSYRQNFAMDFVEAVVSQDPSEPYSEPVKTNYGYHIFKIDSVETYASEEERNQALMEQLGDTPYFEESNQFVVEFLQKKFDDQKHFEAEDLYKEWIMAFDSSEISSLPEQPAGLGDETVYTFNGEDYSLDDYHAFIQNTYGARTANAYRSNLLNEYTLKVVDNNIIDLTLEKYPKFSKQSESYLNGLVVYNINEENIWSPATVDTSRLHSIYEENISKYQYPERPFYYLMTARHDSTLMKAKDFVNNGGSPDSVKVRIDRIGVSADSTTNFTQEPFDRLSEMEIDSFSETFEYNKIRGIFWLEDRLQARNMTFDEAFNRILAEFQPQREKEWLQQLRDKYNVKVHVKKLRKAFDKDA